MSLDEVRQLIDDIFDCNKRDLNQGIAILERIEVLVPFLNTQTLQLEKYINPFLVKLLVIDEITERVSNVMAQLCGRIALGETTTQFDFKEFQLTIRETSYTEAEIGFQTWGGGILLAKMIDEEEIIVKDKVVLELGSGTGLAGLVSGKKESELTIMTDYHPVVIKNCVENIERNHLNNVICLELDWRCIYDGFEKQDKRLDQKFEMILAADCIFDLSHSELVPKITKHYLQPSGVFHVILPHRIKFKKEIKTFEENMIKEGFLLKYDRWIEKHALDFRYYIYTIE